jgi:hypothetical protein
MQRAKVVDDQNATVEFQFNPETIGFTKAAEWKEDATQSNADAPVRQFIGTKPLELNLKMVLDDATSTGSTVAQRVNQLLAWTNPVPNSSPPRPHNLRFEWGQLQIGLNKFFQCHCQSVAVEYLLFTTEGTPTRATATVKLVGLPTKVAGQNPTSGALRPLRSETLLPGDDLAVLSHRQYGSTRHWRALAELNGIDNPFRPPIGRELVLPLEVGSQGWDQASGDRQH